MLAFAVDPVGGRVRREPGGQSGLQGLVMQRSPERDPDSTDERRYRDNEYTGVKLLKMGLRHVYQIMNDGPFQGKKLWYTDGKYHVADDLRQLALELGRPAETLGYVAEGDDEDKRFAEGEPFDIGTVSAGRNLLPQYEVGEKGIGVAYPTAPTRLQTSGILSCVGWRLSNDRGGYLTHIVVLRPQNVSPAGIKEQVQGLYGMFVQNVGPGPARLTIAVDQENLGYPKDLSTSWLKDLVPTGELDVEFIRVSGELALEIPRAVGVPRMWEGPPVKVDDGS